MESKRLKIWRGDKQEHRSWGHRVERTRSQQTGKRWALLGKWCLFHPALEHLGRCQCAGRGWKELVPPRTHAQNV